MCPTEHIFFPIFTQKYPGKSSKQIPMSTHQTLPPQKPQPIHKNRIHGKQPKKPQPTYPNPNNPA